MSEDSKPFELTRERSQGTLIGILALGLSCLVISNIPFVKQYTLFGGSSEALISNVGFALATLAAFQWRYESHHREIFFREIRTEIAGAESARSAGVGRIHSDSKRLVYKDLILKAREIDLGVSYSDRFLKDYNSSLVGRPNLTLRVFYSNPNNGTLIDSLAFMVRKERDHIVSSLKTFCEFIDQIESTGTCVVRVPMDSISHYSFIRFDYQRSFIALSTFSSRRADVPCLDLPYDGFINQFVTEDINCALEMSVCHPTSDQPSKPWYRNIRPTKSSKNSD